MTSSERPFRFHVTLPLRVLEALRARYPGASRATAIREALRALLDPTAAVLHLTPALRSALATRATQQGQPLELVAVLQLREALEAQRLDLPAGLVARIEDRARRAAVSPAAYLDALLGEGTSLRGEESNLGLLTFALVRHLLLLAVDNDVERETEIVRQAESWAQQQPTGSPS